MDSNLPAPRPDEGVPSIAQQIICDDWKAYIYYPTETGGVIFHMAVIVRNNDTELLGEEVDFLRSKGRQAFVLRNIRLRSTIKYN